MSTVGSIVRTAGVALVAGTSCLAVIAVFPFAFVVCLDDQSDKN